MIRARPSPPGQHSATAGTPRKTTEAAQHKILFLHCALGRRRDWTGLRHSLRTPIHGHAIDLPGHGDGPAWDGIADYHAQAVAHARAALAAPAVVIGHSLGATVALRLALETPDLVSALVLIEPVIFAAARGTWEYAAHDKTDQAVLQATETGDTALAAERFLASWGLGVPFDKLPKPDRDRFADMMPLINATRPALNTDNAGLLAPGRLEGLGHPVLLVQGDRSPKIIDKILQTLGQRLPNAANCIIAGAGHMLPLTHPQALAPQIDDFLAHLTMQMAPPHP